MSSAKKKTNKFVGKPVAIETLNMNWASEVEQSGVIPDDSEQKTFDRMQLNRERQTLPSAPKAVHEIDESEVPTEPPYQCHIGSLDYNCDEKDVAHLFSELQVVSIKLVKNKEGAPAGYGYVVFTTRTDLICALKMDKERVGNREVKIGLAVKRDDRRGGDRGGRQRNDNFSFGDGEADDDWRGSAQQTRDPPARQAPQDDFRRGGDSRYDPGDRGGRDYQQVPSRDYQQAPSRDYQQAPSRDYQQAPSRDYHQAPRRDHQSAYEPPHSDRGGYSPADRDSHYQGGGPPSGRTPYGNRPQRRDGYASDHSGGGGYQRSDTYSRGDYRQQQGRGDQYGSRGSIDRGGGGYYDDQHRGGYGGHQQGYQQQQQYDGRGGYDRAPRGGGGGYRQDYRSGGGGAPSDYYDQGGGGQSQRDRPYGGPETSGRTRNDSTQSSHADRPEQFRLKLEPRSKPLNSPGAWDSTGGGGSSKIFGGAKPVDTAAKERAIEEKLLLKKAEERKAAAASSADVDTLESRDGTNPLRVSTSRRTTERTLSQSSSGYGPRSPRSPGINLPQDFGDIKLAPQGGRTSTARRSSSGDHNNGNDDSVKGPAPAPTTNIWEKRKIEKVMESSSVSSALHQNGSLEEPIPEESEYDHPESGSTSSRGGGGGYSRRQDGYNAEQSQRDSTGGRAQLGSGGGGAPRGPREFRASRGRNPPQQYAEHPRGGGGGRRSHQDEREMPNSYDGNSNFRYNDGAGKREGDYYSSRGGGGGYNQYGGGGGQRRNRSNLPPRHQQTSTPRDTQSSSQQPQRAMPILNDDKAPEYTNTNKYDLLGDATE